MHAFYEHVIALFADTIPPDHGHQPWTDPDQSRSPLHHIALSIDLKDFDAEKARLESLGFAVNTAEHHWVKWRSMNVHDPDGNTVEFVCYDDSLGNG